MTPNANVPSVIETEIELLDDCGRQDSWDRWLQGVQAEIPQFCRGVFWGRGVWMINRYALSWDLVRAPCNLFLGPVWVMVQLSACLMQRVGAYRLSEALRRCPPGLKTRSYAEIDMRLRALLQTELPAMNPDQQRFWETGLTRYQAARQATSEILANMIVLVIGLGVFAQLTPGGLGLGRELAQHWYTADQVQQFWAGPTLGGVWVSVFPPDTPLWLTMTCVIGAICMIALTSATAGFITDPMQFRLGWHQRRLHRMVAALHRSFVSRADNRYQPTEPWLARLFDALDWLRLGG